MRSLVVIFLLLVFSSISANNDLLFKEANKAYLDKKYQLAIDKYNQVLQTGNTSSDLYFNLGNAYLKNNEIGKSILHYQLANKLKPSPEIYSNLSHAQDLCLDKAEVLKNNVSGSIKFKVFGYLNEKTWVYISLVLFALLVFFAVKIPLRSATKTTFNFLALTLIFFLFSVFGAYTISSIKTVNTSAVVISKEVFVRSEANSNAPSLQKLHEGASIEFLEQNQMFTKVKLNDNTMGWIETKSIGLY